jgi:hypothetical protein
MSKMQADGTKVSSDREVRTRWLTHVTSRRRTIAHSLLAALVVAAAAIVYGLHLPSVSVVLEMESTISGPGEIFYAAAEEPFSQDASRLFDVFDDGRWHRYVILLPSQRIDRLRVDPARAPGHAAVRLVEVRSGRSRQRFEGEQLRGTVGNTHQLVLATGAADLQITSVGRDPYLEIVLPQPAGDRSRLWALSQLVAISTLGFLAWSLLELLVALLVRRLPEFHRMRTLAAKVSTALSDDGVLEVNGRILAACACIAASALIYVALSLNQSSVGIWENFYPYHPVEQAVDIGTPKRIRSDEWKVQTPWVLNQVLTGNGAHNQNVGGESSPVLASVPWDSALALTQLKYAGFRFLDLDRGVAWWWAYKSFALVLSFFWLLLLLTRGNMAASLLGTAWIYFSSFTQWWLSSNLPEMMTAFAVATIGAIYVFFSARRAHIVAGGVLLFYAASNFTLNLYPPFIVPLVYLGIATVGGYAIANDVFPRMRQRIAFRFWTLGITVAVIAIYLLAFFGAASESIEAVRHTVYPGRRLSVSGDVSTAKLLYGFFEAFRLGERQVPIPTQNGNACEASSFVLLFPLVFILLPWRAWRRRGNTLLLALTGFCLVAIAWATTRLPGPVEHLMQVAGWSLVPPKRAVLALGIASILVCSIFLAQVQAGELERKSGEARRLAVVAAVSVVLVFGWGLRQIDPSFFSWTVIALGTIACLLIGCGMAFGRTSLAATGVAIFLLPAISVNPLVSGISSLTEKPILVAAERDGGKPGDKWIVIGDNFFAQGLKAHGLSVFGGAQYLPDYRNLLLLDPGRTYEHIWNRYATVRVVSDPGTVPAVFKQTRGDQYTIALDVCASGLARLGTTHVAYTVDVPEPDLACLEPLPAPTDSGVRLFKLKG